MAVKERLKEFIKRNKIPNKVFSASIGVSEAYISSMRKSIQPDKLESIALQYPELNIKWLLTGDGEMINVQKQEQINNQQTNKNNEGDEKMKDKLINAYEKTINALESENERLKREIASITGKQDALKQTAM